MTPLRVLDSARAVVRIVGRAAAVHAYEVGALASTAAMAPLCFVGGGFEPASSLSPHTKAHAAPMARPVLLVHGFGGTKSSWSVIAQALSDRGIMVDTITYSPLGNSVEQLADQLVAAVERTLSQTGADKVHLVGHSLGGVVIAQAITGGGLVGLVDTVITLGSPFGGSPWAGLLPFGDLLRALRPGSPQLRRLASAPVPVGVGGWQLPLHGHHRPGLAVGARPRRRGDHHGRWHRPSRHAHKSAGCRLHSRRLARTRVARGGGAAYTSVANGRWTSRNGVLTEGVLLIGNVVDGFWSAIVLPIPSCAGALPSPRS